MSLIVLILHSAYHKYISCLLFITVYFKEYKTGVIYDVVGRLQFYEPWWAATIRVQKNTSTMKRLVGTPSYRIRCDEDVMKDRVVLLLMKACNVHEQHIAAFAEFL